MYTYIYIKVLPVTLPRSEAVRLSSLLFYVNPTVSSMFLASRKERDVRSAAISRRSSPKGKEDRANSIFPLQIDNFRSPRRRGFTEGEKKYLAS